MRELLLLMALGLFCLNSVTGKETTKTFWFGTGFRQDNLDWNIAGNSAGTNPNILSELKWTQIKSVPLYFNFDVVSSKLWLFSCDFTFSAIYSGKNQDSDYLNDNRTNEFSRSNNSAGDGYNLDLDLIVGHVFLLSSEQNPISITPLLGYARHAQHLTITDGVQTVSTDPSALGPFSGLDSSYDTTWNSLWIGFDVKTPFSRRLALDTGVQLHLADYFAEADWNLRADFQHPVSFTHEGTGYAWLARVGLIYKLSQQWGITITDVYQKWKISDGTDRLFRSTGAIVDTRLNQVNWNSNAVLIGAAYTF